MMRAPLECIVGYLWLPLAARLGKRARVAAARGWGGGVGTQAIN